MAQPFVDPCAPGVIQAEPCPRELGIEIPSRRRRMVLAACVLASSMAFIDGSVLTVALPKLRAALGTDLATVQFEWPLGMPLCRSLGAGLWEVRSTLPSRRIARLLFFVGEGRTGVVHGFIKKTQTISAEDLQLARRRMKEMRT